MPKISTQQKSVGVDGVRTHYDLVVNYNSNHGFYAKLPDFVREQYDLLTDAEKKELKLQETYKTKYGSMKGEKAIIICSAATEGQAISDTEAAVRKLCEKSVQKRNVIVLFYDGEASTRFSSDSGTCNADNPEIKMQMGLLYCVETKAVGGSKPIYNIYREYSGISSDEKRTSRQEVSLSYRKHVILDDTPERRAALEQLYNAFATVHAKLEEFTKTPETLLQFITANKPLLIA